MNGKSPLLDALRSAHALPLEPDLISGCLASDDHLDRLFDRACTDSLAALAPEQCRGGLAGVTGHVGESIVEVVLVGHGWSPVWHLTGPGRHGVDLLLLGPGAERLVAVEVKATLRPRRWPRVPRHVDMPAWLDKSDNPGMADWGVTAEDVYGAVALVSFHELGCRVALTNDFATWRPVARGEELDDLDWLDR